MNYTKIPEANRRLTTILKICEELILSNCRPIAILLAGSYARGEGLVIKHHNKLKFISDLDVYIIGEKSLKPKMAKIDNLLRKKIKDVEVNIQYMNAGYQHDDLSTLDLKYQTKLLYGQPVHESIHINEQRALKTSIRFLMAKSKYLLFIGKDTSKNDTILFCSRVYAEMATVLCSKAGIYKSTYLGRYSTIKKIRFPGINKNIIERIVRFTKYRIGHEATFNEGKLHIYHQTVKDLFAIWSFILKIPIKEVAGATSVFQKALEDAFFGPYVDEVFERIFRLTKPPVRQFWIKLAQIYDLIPFLFLQFKSKDKNVYILRVSPYIWIYSRIISSINRPYPEKNNELAELWDFNAHRRYHF